MRVRLRDGIVGIWENDWCAVDKGTVVHKAVIGKH